MRSFARSLLPSLTAALAFAAVLALGRNFPWAAPGPATVTFDLGQAHRFSGFGGQVWPAEEHKSIRRQVYHELNVRFVRLGNLARPNGTPLRSGAPVPELLAALRNAQVSTRTRAAAHSLAEELRSMKIAVHLVVWEMPPEWRTEKSGPDGRPKRMADTAHLADYANYVTAQVLYARALGFDVIFCELTNEPNGAWNTRWEPNQYARLVEAARRAFDGNGLQSVGIEGPGTSNERTAPPFFDALDTTGAAASLAAYSVHVWDSRFQRDPVGLTEAFRSSLGRMKFPRPLHVTEFGNLNSRWSEPPYRAGPEQRAAGPNSVDTGDYGVALAGSALKLIGDGAERVTVWQLQDLPWGRGSMGLIDLQGNLRPSVAALATFLRLVPQPARVVAGSPELPEVVAAAFALSGRTVVALGNVSGAARQIRISLHGTPPPRRIEDRSQFAASGGDTLPDAAIADGLLLLKLPPNAIAAVAVQ